MTTKEIAQILIDREVHVYASELRQLARDYITSEQKNERLEVEAAAMRRAIDFSVGKMAASVGILFRFKEKDAMHRLEEAAERLRRSVEGIAGRELLERLTEARLLLDEVMRETDWNDGTPTRLAKAAEQWFKKFGVAQEQKGEG